ncbi:MAG: c-type cytochrome biogenesis protein CcmI [Pseudomonadales bacterium]|nr:c-type cytochrome biogenesis protein CcmI [Pseudomonadales bacterium]
MTLFWILAAGLCLVATTFVLLPLYYETKRYELESPSLGDNQDREGLNVAIYSERLTEYKHSLESGDIDSDEFNLLEIELKKNLLSETEEGGGARETSTFESHRSVRFPLAMALLIPLFAVISYSDFGLSWGAIDDVVLAEEMKRTDPHDKQGMSDSVDKLAAKLKTQPDNHDGWFLLAQSYLNMAEYEKSAAAFKFLMTKFPRDHGIASYYAETIYMAENRELTARAIAAIDHTLSLNPSDVTMLEIKAMGAFGEGKLVNSLNLFRRALASNPDPERAELIERAISRIEEDLVAANISIPKVTKQKPTASQGVSKKREIQILVEVADTVDAGASMSVFVFARALNGPPMPLAVERLARGALPKLVTLNESMAMMEGMGLANFDKVQVVARISSSGIANVSPEDYQALSETIDLTADNAVIKLRIEKQVKDF